jgi:hypothetical protein
VTWSGRRLGAAALALLALGFAGGAAFAGQPAAPWHALTGDDWRAMEPKERAAFLDGFLSGSGLADAEHAGARDSLALMQAVSALRREGKLRFPFGPSVYESRVSDHYVWENHRPQPLWYGLREVNAHLRAATDSGR